MNLQKAPGESCTEKGGIGIRRDPAMARSVNELVCLGGCAISCAGKMLEKSAIKANGYS